MGPVIKTNSHQLFEKANTCSDNNICSVGALDKQEGGGVVENSKITFRISQ